MSNVKDLSDQDFSANGVPLTKTTKPILVAVVSRSCPYCVSIMTPLAQVAADGRILVGKLTVDNSTIARNMLQVTRSNGVPTLLLFKNGQFKGKHEGGRDAQSLTAFALSV
jgi:thioredoxin-like negative regulator of GroEL